MPMITIKRVVLILFATSALSFTFLLLLFFVFLVLFDYDKAKEVWGGVYSVIAWVISFAICLAFLKQDVE